MFRQSGDKVEIYWLACRLQELSTSRIWPVFGLRPPSNLPTPLRPKALGRVREGINPLPGTGRLSIYKTKCYLDLSRLSGPLHALRPQGPRRICGLQAFVLQFEGLRQDMKQIKGTHNDVNRCELIMQRNKKTQGNV